MIVNDKITDAWLEYTSANQFKAEYFLMKYLELLSKEQLKELLENFHREHSNLTMDQR